jgi:peptide-methionine (R)-S-oxide reductase
MSNDSFPLNKPLKDWQAELPTAVFQVTRQKGTEPPFNNPYYQHKATGVYHCICCESPLFTSDTKYDSGSGWPSFWQPVSNNAIITTSDTTHGMVRTEIQCSQCGAHLGHVFNDGPVPTGQRYCVNSLSLNFKQA